MILKLCVLVFILVVVGLVGRWLIDTHGKDNEQLRKLLHIIHGSGLAALAFVIPLEFIIAIEIVFLFSMIIARYLTGHFERIPWIGYMKRMYSVGRLSYGEFFFPISAITLVFLAESSWEFAAAILILGAADAMAAVIGKKYGASSTYLVFGQKKSLVGSVTFFIVTCAIIVAFSVFGDVVFSPASIALIFLTTLIVTIAENLGVYGSDNLLIPLVAVLLLNRL